MRPSIATSAMRVIPVLVFAIAMSAAQAGNPPYTCRAEQGCVEERESVHDIGRGVRLSLPDGWTYFAYPQASEMMGLREIRAFRGKVVVAITPFPNIDGRPISESWVREMNAKANAQYVARSKERGVNFVSISRGDLVGGYSSFTSSLDGDRPFAVLPNRSYASVTSFLLAYKAVIFSVSVVSEGAPDEDYAQAIQAFRELM